MSRRNARTLAVLLALVVGTSCERGRPNLKRVRANDVSVVWITLDAAGARHLSTYGNPLPTAPNIDALARDGGTVFERAYAQAAWTLPSTASFLTGRYPSRRKQSRMRVDGETLASALSAAGFATAAFSENPYVTATYGFDRGFDALHEYFPEALLHQDAIVPTPETARLTTDALAWLDAQGDRRAFLYLHLLAPHAPYEPPHPFGGRLDPQYDGAITGDSQTLLGIDRGTLDVSARDLEHLRLSYLENLAYGDHQVGRVVEALRATGRLDRTIVIVTSDHGEAFREHGRMLHTTTLFEEMIHVPLVLRMPPRYGALPARSDAIVELRDLVPTLCHALHVRCRASPGRSLLHVLRVAVPRERVARSWTSDGAGCALGAIVTNERKVIMDVPRRRLVMYDLRTDAHEGWNLAPEERVRVRRLARRLRAPRPRPMLGRTTAAIDDETVRKLRAIGYVE